MDSARKIVVVPARGLCVLALRDLLGVQSAQIKPLLGVEICQPRDYRRTPTADILNVQGVRRLVALLELADVDVIEEGAEASPAPEPAPAEDPRPRAHHHPHGDRANGYQPDGEDE